MIDEDKVVEISRKLRVIMVGADRSVHGGVSAVVNNYYEAGLDKKIELRYIGTMVDGSKIRKLAKAIQSYVKFLFQVAGCDIVHINMASDSSYYRKLYFIRMAKLFHKKVLIHQHGGDFQNFYYRDNSEKGQEKIQINLNRADKMIVLSDSWKEFFEKLIPADRIEVLPNAVKIPENCEKDYNNQDILFLGRLCKDKGIDELIDAVCELHQEFPKVHLYLGGVWEDEELRQKAEQYAEFITFLGWIGSREKNRMLRKCSIFTLPSYFEGMPVSVLEGMAYGCTVVVTPVGGLQTIIKNEENGILVDRKSKDSLKDGLVKVLNHTDKKQKLGINARKTIRENYEIDRNIEKLLQIYQQLVEV